MVTRNFISVIFFLSLGVALGACRSDAERKQGAEAKPSAAPDDAIRLTPEQARANGVQTTAVTAAEVAATMSAIGRVESRAGGEAQVFSPFAGRLIADPERLPRIGSAIRKGRVIAEVEQTLPAVEKTQFASQAAQLETEIVRARQEVAWRQTELERAKQLYEGGAIPLKRLQTANFDLEQAQAKLDGATRAKSQVDAIISQQNAAPRRAPITAPISGAVIAADLAAGEQVEPSKSLLTIVDLSSVWVEIAVHENQLPLARRARQVEFTTPANPGRTYNGRLYDIGAVADPENRTVKVIYVAPNPDGSLKLGLTAEARIPTGPRAQALLIPASAVLYEESETFVFVESETGVFRRRRVVTGERSGERIVVSQGLNQGEKVVSSGAGLLRGETLKGQFPTEVEERR